MWRVCMFQPNWCVCWVGFVCESLLRSSPASLQVAFLMASIDWGSLSPSRMSPAFSLPANITLHIGAVQALAPCLADCNSSLQVSQFIFRKDINLLVDVRRFKIYNLRKNNTNKQRWLAMFKRRVAQMRTLWSDHNQFI